MNPPPQKKMTSLPSVHPTHVTDSSSSDLLNLFMELFFPHHRSSRRSLPNTFRVYTLSFCSPSHKGSVFCPIRSTATRIYSSSMGRTTQFCIPFEVFLGVISPVFIAALIKILIQGCTNPGRLIFFTLVPNIFGSLVWNLIHVGSQEFWGGLYTSGPEMESRWGEIFRTCSDRPWDPPSLL